ncbi:hypothetical protein CspeluHIS016_0902030 [Cutaneotrichosporon spelunceum]|uniref:Uncharacterized protein n=1 Tax=Cutaneotrichosporon spelunceum TaxID=1672016 RepID=A0AAD3U0E2_9TREE|nr:hypothetical protein CspeluHIS016_0902030 [Cutaneotrichosporon spelunceum]
MLDPTSPLTAPPPRYRIESDSSDEEGQGVYPTTSHRASVPAPAVNIRILSVDSTDPNPTSISGSAVVGIGQAGKFLLRRSAGRPLFQVEVGGQPAGMGVAIDGGVLVALQDGPEPHEVVKQLAGLVKASSWTLFSSYVPSMYIPKHGEHVPSDPPVRVLSSIDAKGVSYDAPNYVTGMAGAFLSQAAHPTGTIPDATLYLLPLPLSQLSSSALQLALSTLPNPISKALGRRAHWDEDDDERFAGPGMGARPRESSRAEGGMYM